MLTIIIITLPPVRAAVPRALIGIVTYFVAGGVYLYRVKGARGVEMIPNYAFWKDIPFLIKVRWWKRQVPLYSAVLLQQSSGNYLKMFIVTRVHTNQINVYDLNYKAL